MSLARLVYYSAVVGGWAAFFGWLVAETLIIGGASGRFEVILVAGTVGATIGAGVSLVAGLANGQRKQLLVRATPGFFGGALAGAMGGLTGDFMYGLGLPRAIGWLVMGLSIGVVDGMYEQSRSKIRNGLIGGAIGGLLGGVLFDLLYQLISSASGMSSRATAFVVLGIAIGALIGLAQVVLKDAWLTVLDGYRAGRQLILSQPVVTLGRGEHLPLPFLGQANQELEKEHVRITRQANGTYEVEDLKTKVGTRLNKHPLRSPTVLRDGDVIKLGGNFIRFNERQRRRGEADGSAATPAVSKTAKAPPPPPPTKAAAAAKAANSDPIVARLSATSGRSTATNPIDSADMPLPKAPPPPPIPKRSN